MAVPTTFGLLCIATGVLWTRPRLAIMDIVTNTSFAGATLRRLLPIVIASILLVGAARVAAKRLHLVDEITGIALVVAAMLVILTIVVLVTSRSLHRISRTLAARERVILQDAVDIAAARDAAAAASVVKSDFMANMSHEIRTPLTAIVGFTDLLTARSDLDAVAQAQVKRIADAGQALQSIVNDILDFSTLEAGQVEIRPQPARVVGLLRDTLAILAPQADAKGLVLEFRANEGLPDALLIDEHRVRQILLNLISNAIKFTDTGKVRLIAAYDAAAGQLDVAVEDTGAGLAPAQQRRLFQRFSQVDASSTRRHGGTGLGLAICKGLAEAMGGDIGVRSAPGEGSVFHFRISAPLAEMQPPAAPPEDARPLDRVRLLVADDHPVNRELVRAILSPMGVDVTEAADGFAAVEFAAATPFDAILMDLRMPGLDGPGAAARIRAEPGPNQDVPILAFSADADLAGGDGVPAGFDGVVRKPIAPAGLLAALSQRLQRGDRAPPALAKQQG